MNSSAVEQTTLFSPYTVGPVRLRNRIVLAPMTRVSASAEGVPTEEMARYYARYGRHGTALIITEATYTDDAYSRAYFDQPGMATDEQMEAWRAVVERVHATGAKILLQLQHAGRLAEVGLHDRPLSPSSETPPGVTWQNGLPYGPVREATIEDVERVVEGFAAAAGRARRAGFDGVEIHGSHGYLLDQFLSEDINRRSDIYGGALEGRLRLALDVVSAVRASIGPDRILSFNYSFWKMEDFGYEPPGGEPEVSAVTTALVDRGVDLIHASTRHARRPVLGSDEPFGRMVKRYSTVPVAAGGSVNTSDDATEILDRGIGDLVVVGRAHAANPDWVERVRRGEELRPYVRGVEREGVAD